MLAQHHLLQPLDDAVGRREDVTGGDENSSTSLVLVVISEESHPGPLPGHRLLPPHYQTVEGLPGPAGGALSVLRAAHLRLRPLKAAGIFSEVIPNL